MVASLNIRFRSALAGHVLIAALALTQAQLRSAEAVADAEFFEAKIRPLLAENCFKCHSHQAEKLKGGLYLDSRDGLLTGGDTGPAIVPGKPEKSLIIEAVGYGNPDLQMPTKTRLAAQQVADLSEWVRRGAPWPASAAPATAAGAGRIEAFDLAKRRASWWAWRPVAAAKPPTVADERWPKGPIDRFVLAKLEEKGLHPAPPASRRTLIRRLYADLIGLPPTPEQVDAFLADTSPGAVATLVDGLLASPRFGERWGRHWLDLVRYAESRGHEFDYPIPDAWQYRDYVIRAFNADVPYDRFVTEHLAGDLIAEPRLDPRTGGNESVLGTGFFFLGEGVHSPVDIRQDQADRLDNMVDVTCKTFLGLTVACARCHDHKFDAIRTRDYYALEGYLESSSYRLVRFDAQPNNRAIAAQLWQARREHGPAIAKALTGSWRPVLDHLDAYLLAAREALPTIARDGAGGDEVFEDFEKGTYEGWEVTGTAFGTGPQTLQTIAAYQGRINAVGTYFVNSHREHEGGDAPTGTLTSRPFTVAHPWLRMLVGGGDHPGKTCVDLLVDGRVALSATGRASNQMFPVTWDLRPFAGKTARIRIVDADSGPWGNIGVDQIVFSDHAEPAEAATAARLSGDDRKRIAALAEARHLDAAELGEWITHLLGAATRAGDPFQHWAAATSAAPVAGSTADATAMPDGTMMVVDYAKPGAEDWLPDDVSFGPGPVRAGELRLGGDPAQPVAGICERTAAAFDPLWNGMKRAPDTSNDPIGLDYERAGRTLCTPSFVIAPGRIFVLAKGSARLYAAVDQHALIYGPLHGALLSKLESTDGYRWQALDLGVYAGHRVHLELTATSADFAVAAVAQGATMPAQPTPGCRALVRAFGTAGGAEAQARACREVFDELAARLGDGRLAGSDDAADLAPLADWMIQHPRLFAADTALLREAQPFLAAQTALIAKITWESHLAPALMDANGVDGYVMKRGQWRNHGEPAPRQLLEAIGGADQPGCAHGSGRLELARRLLDRSDPFVGRVLVNRLWHHLFGRGIVATVDNFGKLGEQPTNPELLDYLADDFVANGWSIKRAIRAMVLSASYQMASTVDPAADQKDPGNLLLHRQNLRRLEGEIIRDDILAVSGRLDLKAGGPSVPIFVTSFMEGRGRPASGPLDGAGRRSIYQSVWRNFLSPMMLAFDVPIPFNSAGRRSVSNVPAQALILMNDPFVAEQARRWAQRLLAQRGLDAAQRVARMYLEAFARPPADSEVAAVLAFRERQAGELHVGGDDPAVWADIAHALFNCKEFIFTE